MSQKTTTTSSPSAAQLLSSTRPPTRKPTPGEWKTGGSRLGCYFDGKEFTIIPWFEPSSSYYYTFLPDYEPPTAQPTPPPSLRPTLPPHETVAPSTAPPPTEEEEEMATLLATMARLNLSTVMHTFPPRKRRTNILPYPLWAFSYMPLLDSFAALGLQRLIPAPSSTTTTPTFIFTKQHIPLGFQEGKQIINSLGSVPCLAGSKDQQLRCRQQFTRAQGCDYLDLNVQPVQYDLKDLDQCRRFMIRAAQATHISSKSYIVKPMGALHGDGQEVFLADVPGQIDALFARYGNCTHREPMLVMDYVAKPATMMGGYKFDLRTFLLVASLHPLLAFQYEHGVVRRGKDKYTTSQSSAAIHIMNSRDQSGEDHLYGFPAMQQALVEEMHLPQDHFERVVRPQLHLVAKFLVATQFTVRVADYRFPRGRFQVFALDWVLDSAGRVHFLEANGYPALFTYERAGLPADMWPSCAELVRMVQIEPTQAPTNMTERHRYAYKQWRLVYNYVEDKWEKDRDRAFNACELFKHK